jgi:hypothetical protein
MGSEHRRTSAGIKDQRDAFIEQGWRVLWGVNGRGDRRAEAGRS